MFRDSGVTTVESDGSPGWSWVSSKARGRTALGLQNVLVLVKQQTGI